MSRGKPSPQDLPTHLLRTFVAIVDEGGFTQAAEVLARTQPTVSQQLRKLEGQVGQALLERGHGGVRLTTEGQTLLDYARRILALNDEAVSSLSRVPVSGRLRLGIPHEFTFSVLPKLVGAFSQIEPHVVIEVECELSKKLLEHRESYDLVMMLHRHGEGAAGTRIRDEPLAWVSSLDYRFDAAAPLKIVAAPAPCLYRGVLQRALADFKPGWSLLLSSTSYGAVCAAVSTGMGITVLARSVVPANLQILDCDSLPALPQLDLRLHYDPATATDAALTFAEFIQEKLRDQNDLSAD